MFIHPSTYNNYYTINIIPPGKISFQKWMIILFVPNIHPLLDVSADQIKINQNGCYLPIEANG